MPPPATVPPASRRWSRLTAWVAALAGLGSALVWFLPTEEPARIWRVTIIQLLLLLALLVGLVWWLCCSRRGWALRLGVLLVIPALAFAAVGEIVFTGDMIPIPVFRWQANPGDALSAERKAPPTGSARGPEPDSPADFPEYRNRARDGVALGPRLARDWRTRPPKLLWKRACGGGYSAFAVAGTSAVTMEQRGDFEAVVCYDAATGRERWVQSYPARFREFRSGAGPRATPTIAHDAVYTLGAAGKLLCLDLAAGDVRWGVDILADNDNLTWGMSGSPLVYGDVVIVNPGEQRGRREGRALVAYNRRTGRRAWAAGDTQAGYASPMLVRLAGKPQVVIFDAVEVAGYDPRGAGKLWSARWVYREGINVAQPVALPGDRIFLTAGYEAGCAVVRVGQAGGRWRAETLWHNRALRCRFTSPVAYQGFLYGLDEGVLVCVDPADGRRLWRGTRYGNGQLVRSDDLLLIQAESGALALVKACPREFQELGRFRALEGEKTWNCPCLARGKAFVRNHREMACYDLTE